MPDALPLPSDAQAAHSARLAAVIRAEIARAGGALDFARFMELALYAPGLGYYSAGATKFGAAGDFITAPELGDVYARCLARAIAPTLRATGGDLVELGPGTGALAATLLDELARLDALPQRYRLLERSAELRARQQATLTARAAPWQARIDWLDAPPAAPWQGVLVANEVIDALPVRLFTLRDEGLVARAVADAGDDRFAWVDTGADAALEAAVAARLGDAREALPRPYTSELCTLLAPWFAEVTRTLTRGMAVFADYGHAHGAYYALHRHEGTLRCHYRHRVHDDPLVLVGLQDITSWVDFDALLQTATDAGFRVVDHATQAQFLIGNGLEDVFGEAYAQATDEAARYALAQQVKRLTLPGEMGDAFRVVVVERP